MTAKSMTGFARHEDSLASHLWFWELRSVNGRGLDVRLRLAPGHDFLEPFVREAVRKKFSRGSIQISLNVRRSSTEPQIRINEQVIDNLLEMTRAAGKKHGLDQPGFDSLLNVRGVVETVEAEESEEENETRVDAMKAGFLQALGDLAKAREEEGERLADIIQGQLMRIGELADMAANAPSRAPENIRTRIAEQIARITGSVGDMDADRLHQEAVLIAAKADIQEELDRLQAHISAARDLLKSDAPSGRKLDFLAQEFNRESNTLCSKSNHVDLTEIGLELKVVVDQMREQVQNIE
jgi:uncharacterized protein (TIGR00255 family)